MKKIERGSVQYLLLFTLFLALFGLIFYPLFDLFICQFITNSKFVYSTNSHIIQPVVFACIFGVTFWAIDRKGRKNNK